MSESVFENTLRSQREIWRQVISRVSAGPARELPTEPPKRLLFFGLGSSGHVAHLVTYALGRDRTRTRVPMWAGTPLLLQDEARPQKGDWAFAFTHRGTNALTLDALRSCRKAGATTLLVTSDPVAEEHVKQDTADLVIGAGPLERVEPHSIAITGAVAAATSLLMGAKVAEEWEALAMGWGDPSLDACRERMGTKPPTVFLGEGVGYWLAREGSLKFIETVRIPARAYGSEEFFHGPSWGLQPEDRVLWVETPGDPRAAMLKAATRVTWSGGSPLAWIPALVELQWLALASALNAGKDPDQPVEDARARLGAQFLG